MSVAVSDPSVHRAAASGATVVTVNNRLARVIVAAHDAHRLSLGERAWETPRVLPFDAFVAAEWEAARERSDGALPRLLGPVEVRALWQQALADSGAGALLSPGAAASSAQAARELLARYGAELTPADCGEHEDARAFARWHRRYRAALDDAGAIDPPAAAGALAGLVRDGTAPRPRGLRLAGFDRLTPQQHSLLDAYREVGVAVHVETADGGPGQACRVELPSPERELEAAARWARALLETGEAGPIGIVVPDLATRLDEVEGCFEDVLHPGAAVTPRPASGARAFNVSLGRPLLQWAAVTDALAALETVLGTADARSAGRVLLCPYLAGAREEQAQRLGLEARLRDEGVRAIRCRHLARLADRAGAARMARQLEAAIREVPRARARQSLDVHAARFARALGAVGWPAGRGLDSGEHQAVEAFRARLEALGAAGGVSAPCSAGAALGLLRALVAQTPFQPRAASAPVQVLGVLEAAGTRFRALWLAGFHDGAWPSPEASNPLLPMALQRRHAMPGADARQSLERARRITSRLLSAAPRVVVSHATAQGEEPLRVSPLLASLAPAAPDALPCSAAALPDAAIAGQAPTLEQLEDWRGRAVGHGWRARGGSRVLTDQAACPFRAFARHRLGAVSVARAPAPLDARSRGILAHRLMQALFQAVNGSQALASLDGAALQALAGEAADRAVAAVVRAHPGEVPPALAAAERDRLCALALRWLALEAARPPFQVESVEQRRVVRVGGLKLDIQLDRVDRVDGRRLLLDYKTGRARRGAWFGDRPDEPQLPLYALALDAEGGTSAPVAAVAFARLRRGDECFEGVAEDPAWAPGLAPLGAGAGGQQEFPDMAALKAHWAEVLGDLAEGFADGDARVDPKPQACRYCDVRPLCRVDALRRPPEEDAP